MNHHLRNMISNGYEEANIEHPDDIKDNTSTMFVTFLEHELPAIIAGIAYIAGVPANQIKIIPCPPVSEDCISINGTWCGYVYEWHLQGHVHRYQK